MTNKERGHNNVFNSIGEDGRIRRSVAHTKKDGEGRGEVSLSRFFLPSPFFFLKKPSLSNYDSPRLFCYSMYDVFSFVGFIFHSFYRRQVQTFWSYYFFLHYTNRANKVPILGCYEDMEGHYA